MKSPSFIFFGTPDVASETLELLKVKGYVPEFIICAPDRPVGRHFVMTAPPAKAWALENDVPFIQPEKVTSEIVESLPVTDLYIVVAYGKILPQTLIDRPALATLNIHYSLLPRWRGASPVEAAILHGDSETGVSIQKMVFKLDAGAVIAEKRIPIEPDDTTPSLRGKLIPLGAELLANIFEQLQTHLPNPLPKGKRESEPPSLREGLGMGWTETVQDESLMTHCGKTKKEDGLIDPEHDDPEAIYRKYRAYQPWPGLYFMQHGKRVKITKASYANGTFKIERVVREGEKESEWHE